MRERLRDRGRIEDIVYYCKNVVKIVAGVELDSFADDILVYYATMKNVEIVGEAAYMLTKEFKESHPQIPWRQIEGMRHVLVHGYSQIAPAILWSTAKNSIPELLEQAEELLQNIDWEEYARE